MSVLMIEGSKRKGRTAANERSLSKRYAIRQLFSGMPNLPLHVDHQTVQCVYISKMGGRRESLHCRQAGKLLAKKNQITCS